MTWKGPISGARVLKMWIARPWYHLQIAALMDAAIHAERALLGAMLTDLRTQRAALPLLSPEGLLPALARASVRRDAARQRAGRNFRAAGGPRGAETGSGLAAVGVP